MNTTYSAPIAKVVSRMAFHCQTGQALEGFTWHDVPTEHQDGPSDLPAVQLFIPNTVEQFRSRGVGEGLLQIKLSISVARSAGIEALMVAAAKVANAIEKSEAGRIDPYLEGTLGVPFDIATADAFATRLSLNLLLVLNCATPAFRRGER